MAASWVQKFEKCSKESKVEMALDEITISESSEALNYLGSVILSLLDLEWAHTSVHAPPMIDDFTKVRRISTSTLIERERLGVGLGFFMTDSPPLEKLIRKTILMQLLWHDGSLKWWYFGERIERKMQRMSMRRAILLELWEQSGLYKLLERLRWRIEDFNGGGSD